MALSGRHSRVKVAGAPVAVTDEAMTDAGDHTTYQVSDAAHRVLSRSGTVTVKVDDVAADASTYALDRLAGRVVFDAAQAAGAVVTLDASYLPLSDVAQANKYEYDLSAQNEDATTFVNDGFTVREQAQLDVSGSVGAFYDTSDTLFRDALLAGDVVVLAFYADADSAPSATCWALLDKVADAAEVAALVSESIDFVGTTDADGRAVSFG